MAPGLATRAIVLTTALTLSACASTRVLRPFTTDGCSLFPDGDREDAARWCACCVTHDQAYWRGGTADQRKRADELLRDCVRARTGRGALAGTMYRGVRVGGMPLLPTWFRWGYGWGLGRGYAPLTAAEQQRADALLAEHDKAGSTQAPFCAR